MPEFTHRPVLLDECIQALNIRPDGVYLDGTLGRGGHSREIARRLTTGRLICVDRDQTALDEAGEILAPWRERVTLVHGNFARLDEICCAAEKAMAELEELQLSMADQIPPGQPIPFPGRRSQGKKQKNF